MKFIKFGDTSNDTAPTIYPTESIECIVLYDKIYEVEDSKDEYNNNEIKILLFIKGEEIGTAERFAYEGSEDAKFSQELARARFDQLLRLLNS